MGWTVMGRTDKGHPSPDSPKQCQTAPESHTQHRIITPNEGIRFSGHCKWSGSGGMRRELVN